MVGPGEPVVGGGEVTAGVTSAAQSAALEPVFSNLVFPPGVVEVVLGGERAPPAVAGWAGRAGRRSRSGGVQLGFEAFTFGGVGRRPLLGLLKLLAGLVTQLVEPVGDLTPTRPLPGSRRARRRLVLFGELAALGDGGDVGAVHGEDAFEDVPGLGHVGAVGDDMDRVLLAAAGDGDVQAAAGGRLAGEVDADGDGVGLVAVLGRRIPQPHMLLDVVGGQGHLAVSFVVGHGERPVAVGGGDGPQFPVAHRLAFGGDQPPVVAPGGHHVADVGVLAAGDVDGGVGVEVADDEPEVLDGGVEQVDVLVRGRHQRHRVAPVVAVDPPFGDLAEMLLQGAGDDPAVRLVGVQGPRVTGPQLE